MNTLVTGNGGFLGRVLTEKLKREGRFVVGIDKEKNYLQEEEGPHIQILHDIRDPSLVRRVMTEYEIDEVYHLASWAIQKHCAADPGTAFDININGLVNVLEACRGSKNMIESVVVSTSDKAFGNAKVPYTEDSPLQPLFVYDSSKACQQIISLAYARNFNLPIKIVASSNFYGPGDFNTTRIIPNTIIRLALNKPAMIWKDSENHVREFVYIDDVANAFVTVSEHGVDGEVYCCGGDDHLKIGKLTRKICDMMEKDPKRDIIISDRPVYLQELESQFTDSSKLRELGWVPGTSLEEGLRKSIEFYNRIAGEGRIHPMRAVEDGDANRELQRYFSD